MLNVAPDDHGLSTEFVGGEVLLQTFCTCHSNPVPQGKLPN